jgi:DNA-binding beta-propeller fold protein YncE
MALPVPSALASPSSNAAAQAGAARAGAAPRVPSTAMGSSGTLAVLSYPYDESGHESPGTVTLISTATNSVTRAVKLSELPSAVALTPNGRTAYVAEVGGDMDGSPGSLVAVNLGTGAVGKPTAVGTNPVAVALAPSGRTVYVTDSYDAATQNPTGSVRSVSTFTGAAGRVTTVAAGPTAMALAPNGQTAIVVGADSVSELVTSTGTVKAPIKVQASAVAITPNSQKAYLIGHTAGAPVGVVPVDTATGDTDKAVHTGSSVPTGLAISPNGQTVYVVGTPDPALGGHEDTVTTISTATDQVGKTIDLGSHPGMTLWQIAVSPNGNTAYALGWGSPKQQGVVIPVNTATDVAGKAMAVGYNASAIVFSPDGDWAYVLDDSMEPHSPGGVVPIDVATGLAGKRIAVAAFAEAIATS